MSSPVIVAKIDQDKLVVTQANKLAEASYTMSLEEKRVVLLLLSLVRKEDRDFQTYRIPIADIRDYLGLRTNKLYDDIKRVADSLLSRVLHIPEDGGGWLKVGWVASARYVPKGMRGTNVACLDLCFSPEMKPYLLELKSHFAGFMLQNVAGLRSFYSIRLYELLKSRRRLGTTMFQVEALRHMLKAEGKYRNYKDFRARVILPAKIELADKTDLAFEFTEARRGRKVVSVTFHIRDNVPANPPRPVPAIARPVSAVPADDRQPLPLPPSVANLEREHLAAEVIAEGVQNGIRETAMRDLLSTRDPRHVLENIELARKRHLSAKGEDVNLAGLTVAAITRDWAAEGREDRERSSAQAEARERARAARSMIDEIEAAATAARKHDIDTRLAALPMAEHEAWRAAYVAEIESGRHGDFLRAGYARSGWKVAERWFRMYAAERLKLDNEVSYVRIEAKRRGQNWDALKADAAIF